MDEGKSTICCKGAGLPGGQFELPGTLPGVTCQVCAHDFLDDGTGILPRHSGSLGVDLYE